jgi:DNA-binding beta-propeller fold protein YncE
MAINRAGTLAIVANRADDSVSVLSIDGKTVKLVDTVSGHQPCRVLGQPGRTSGDALAVAITPDGKRALVVKSGANRVAVLDIEGQKVSYAKVDGKNYDMASGLNPINVEITPDGRLALVNNIGGTQDGQVDTAAVIDLQADPPRVIDPNSCGGRAGRARHESCGRICSFNHPKRHRRHAQDGLLPA